MSYVVLPDISVAEAAAQDTIAKDPLYGMDMNAIASWVDDAALYYWITVNLGETEHQRVIPVTLAEFVEVYS